MMVHDHSPHFNFNPSLPASTGFLKAHDLVEQVCCICPPDSTFNDSAVFSSEVYPTFVCGESNEEASAAEGGCGSGSSSASLSEEAHKLSHHVEKTRRRQSSGRGGGGGRRNETKHPLYKGVRKRKGGRWVSEVREPGKKSRIWLGTFPTPEMAARAYDVAVFNLKSPYAYVNFPEAVSSLPILPSRSPKNIQEAASAAAAAFGGPASSSHAGRSGGLVPTSQVDETSYLPFTSSPMPNQQQQLHLQNTIPEQQQLLDLQSTSPTTATPFFDEDLIFNMPNVLTDMAEALMITAPLLHHGSDGDNDINNSNCDNGGEESPLWDL